MDKKCIKCGHVADLESYSAASSCPACGAVYAKVEAQASLERVRAQRQPAIAEPSTPTPAKKSLTEILAWAFSALASVYASSVLIGGLEEAQSAPQQAALAAMSGAIAVIPYCFARAISSLSRR